MKKSRILMLSVFMLVLVVASNVIFAVTGSVIDTTKTGSLTITTREQNNGSTDTTTAPVLAGVEYTLYKVDEDTITTVAQAEVAIASLTATATKTTGTNGVAAFTGLAVGRYYAKVTDVPTGTSQVPESFLVDIPMTNATGDAWVYDIAVEPKVATATGSVILTKVGEEGEVLSDTKFTVQVSSKNADNTWSDWTGYIKEGTSAVLKLTTNSSGQITVENLPITIDGKEVRFRFFEESASSASYIINNSKLDYFYVQEDGKTVVVHADGTSEQAADVGRIQMINDKTSMTKTIKKDDGTYSSAASAGIADSLEYKIEIDVPSRISELKTFKLEDELPSGIKDRSNLKIVGAKDGVETILTVDEAYTKTETDKKLTLVFDTTNISGYDTIIITYNAYIDIDNADLGNIVFNSDSNNNTNHAILTYTSNVNEDGSEKSTYTRHSRVTVYTGGIKIKKVDSAGNVLSGATFKIAETEADAEAGNFLKDYEGNEIIATSGDDGFAVINGLAYDDEYAPYYFGGYEEEQTKYYYLVETQAPSYTETTDEGEVTKYYRLLSKPLKVSVNGESHESEIEVVNRKELELPLTGGIGIAIFAVVGITIMAMSVAANKKEAKYSANV